MPGTMCAGMPTLPSSAKCTCTCVLTFMALADQAMVEDPCGFCRPPPGTNVPGSG